ncbi:MAG: hypothetical protein LBU34_11710 [Planctomycetaceae bacterium]|nr:hypothetical protein [Planctomycetaceae bacterium]
MNTEPESCPLEINRIFSTDRSFSIIAPPNWKVDVHDNIIEIDTRNKNSPVVQNFAGIAVMKEDFIQKEMVDYVKRELSISTKALSTVNDNKKYIRITYQEKPAICIVEEKKAQLEEQYLYDYCLYFMRNEGIYSIIYYTNIYRKNIPSQSIIDYINSFRIEHSENSVLRVESKR